MTILEELARRDIGVETFDAMCDSLDYILRSGDPACYLLRSENVSETQFARIREYLSHEGIVCYADGRCLLKKENFKVFYAIRTVERRKRGYVPAAASTVSGLD